MPQFSVRLTRLLLIRGAARAMVPLAILWGIYDWYLFDRLAVPPRFPLRALVFALLTWNYVLIYVLGFVAPGALNGPWRIRPWQTFVLLINAFWLPIQYIRHFHQVPWGFILVTLLFIVGLYVGTAIGFHLQEKLPMVGAFASRKGTHQPGLDPSASASESTPPTGGVAV